MYEARQRKAFVSRVNNGSNKHNQAHIDCRKNLNKLSLIENDRNNIIQQMFDGFLPINYSRANRVVLGNRANSERNNHGGAIGNSRVLRASLTGDSYVPEPSNHDIENQAHHIVEANDPNAAQSRAILAIANIDIDSSVNGVLLPTCESDDAGNAAIHLGSHSSEYSTVVFNSLMHAIQTNMSISNFQELLNAQNTGHLNTTQLRDVVKKRLARIREVLLTQNVPLNLSSDPDYTDNGPITIQEIFQNAEIL